VIVADKQVQ